MWDTVEVQTNSKEATTLEVQNQHLERQRQPPVRYGQDEFADTVTEDAAYNIITKQDHGTLNYAGL